jgi:hypothetical protein
LTLDVIREMHAGALGMTAAGPGQPMGKVEIDLSSITTDTTDMWYPLRPDGRVANVTGDVSYVVIRLLARCMFFFVLYGVIAVCLSCCCWFFLTVVSVVVEMIRFTFR